MKPRKYKPQPPVSRRKKRQVNPLHQIENLLLCLLHQQRQQLQQSKLLLQLHLFLSLQYHLLRNPQLFQLHLQSTCSTCTYHIKQHYRRNGSDLTSEADKEAAAKKDARLKSAAAEGATLTASGTAPKPQPVLEADTETPEKKPKAEKLDEFPKFPATGSWVDQLMWLLDILLFNSSIGRIPPKPPEDATVRKPGYIERLTDWKNEKLANFRKNNPNITKNLERAGNIVAAPFKMAYHAVQATGNLVAGAAKMARSAAMFAAGVVVAPVALTRALYNCPPGEKLQTLKNYGMAIGGTLFVEGVAQAVDGVGNAAAVGVTALNGVRDFTLGAVSRSSACHCENIGCNIIG